MIAYQVPPKCRLIPNLWSMLINGVAAVTFIITKAIFWPQALVMTGGSLLGGLSSAHYAQKLPQAWIRGLVILVGCAMTAYFFWRGYH